MWDRFLSNWENYMVRPLDNALIPIASALGDNDFGQNAFAATSDTKEKSVNYFTFLHGYEMLNNENVFHRKYRIDGYNISILNINSGYYGYTQKLGMIDWIFKSLMENADDFKIAFYHNPLFPVCAGHKSTHEESDAKTRITKIFTTLNVRLAFEHHENLYKISHPMRGRIVANTTLSSTIYVGGGQWGTPNSDCNFEEVPQHYYLSKRDKVNHVWALSILSTPKTGDGSSGQHTVLKQLRSVSITGEMLDTVDFD